MFGHNSCMFALCWLKVINLLEIYVDIIPLKQCLLAFIFKKMAGGGQNYASLLEWKFTIPIFSNRNKIDMLLNVWKVFISHAHNLISVHNIFQVPCSFIKVVSMTISDFWYTIHFPYKKDAHKIAKVYVCVRTKSRGARSH